MSCQLLTLGEMAASAKYKSFGTAAPDCPLCRQRITESVRLENRASNPTILSQFEVMVTAEASGQLVVSSFLAQLGFLYICKSLVPLMSAPDIETIHFPPFQFNKNVSR